MLRKLKQAVAGAEDTIRRKPKISKKKSEIGLSLKIGAENRSTLKQFLFDDPQLDEALKKSKNLLEKSVSQVIWCVTFPLFFVKKFLEIFRFPEKKVFKNLIF